MVRKFFRPFQAIFSLTYRACLRGPMQQWQNAITKATHILMAARNATYDCGGARCSNILFMCAWFSTIHA
jgi:hypothetical protein